jgi:hypothetical protein
MIKKIAVVTAPGIGDGLILHVASHNLVQMGWDAATFNDHLGGFGRWLRGYRFEKQPPLERIEEIFSGYDAVLLQHDNTEKAKRIKALSLPVYGFYGSHNPSKHGEMSSLDFVCDPNRNMVENVANAVERWFGACGKENGMRPPDGLVHRKTKRRIAIHASSGAEEKNWPLEKFLAVAKKLENEGYHPVFLTKEKFPTLEELASFLYESGAFLGNDSGPGHIASCLGIPSLIIGKEERQMRLWAPGWRLAEIAVPPRWTSSWRWTRSRWKKFISINHITKRLKDKVLQINCY